MKPGCETWLYASVNAALVYTAFEADGALWQWKRIPFGLTNAVPCFQRVIDDIIKSNDCQGTFAYLDNIIVKV